MMDAICRFVEHLLNMCIQYSRPPINKLRTVVRDSDEHGTEYHRGLQEIGTWRTSSIWNRWATLGVCHGPIVCPACDATSGASSAQVAHEGRPDDGQYISIEGDIMYQLSSTKRVFGACNGNWRTLLFVASFNTVSSGMEKCTWLGTCHAKPEEPGMSALIRCAGKSRKVGKSRSCHGLNGVARISCCPSTYLVRVSTDLRVE